MLKALMASCYMKGCLHSASWSRSAEGSLSEQSWGLAPAVDALAAPAPHPAGRSEAQTSGSTQKALFHMLVVRSLREQAHHAVSGIP